MTQRTPGAVTRLLVRAEQGDRQAAEELLPLVYEELRRLARARLARERPGQTLEPTGLVHEAYLRLVGEDDPGWANRGHFFAAAAEAMRRILIERARRAARRRHGGALCRTTLPEVAAAGGAPPEDLLALDQALTRLAARDPAMATVVKLRYFAGFTLEETAESVGASLRTVTRQWSAARAWLAREFSRERPSALGRGG